MSLWAGMANCAGLAVKGDWRLAAYQIQNRLRGLDLRYASVRELGLAEGKSHWYADSGGPRLARLLRSVSISPWDRILDVGCGKGGAMITLARKPFAQVDGVEISGALSEIARENLRKMRVRNARVFTCDASQFLDLDPYTFLYMSNPFSRDVMRCVVRNLAASLRRAERRITLVYYNPVDRDLFEALGFAEMGEFPQDENPTVVFIREASEPPDPDSLRLSHGTESMQDGSQGPEICESIAASRSRRPGWSGSVHRT